MTKREQNIKAYRYKKGRSGNPQGRPPGVTELTRMLREIKDHTKKMMIDGKRRDWTYGEILAMRMWEMAIKGNVPVMKYIYDRLDGYPRQSVEVKGNMGITMERLLQDEAEFKSMKRKPAPKKSPKKKQATNKKTTVKKADWRKMKKRQ